jgi:hypothetical protein
MEISMASRTEIVRSKRKAYQRVRKKEKIQIITDVMNVTGWSRDHTARCLRGSDKPKAMRKGRGRKPKYGMEHKRVLVMVWPLLDYACSKRLKTGMHDLLEALVAHGHLNVEPKIRKEVEHMSHGTIDRMLRHDREAVVYRGRSTTKPGSLLKHQIPIRRGTEWDDNKIGFMEIDLVAHCGDSARGDFVSTLDATDISSGWTECCAVLNKAQIHTFNAMKAIRARLPFPLLGIDSDNGSEFINFHFFRYCQQEDLVFTRGRPNTSNDSCHVEQKNWSVVRQTVGYARLEGPGAVDILNQIYASLRLINNFFMPSAKLVSKTRDGSRISKVHDKPLTPYRRLLSSNVISSEQRQALKDTFHQLDPVALRQNILRLTRQLEAFVVPYE